MSALGSIAKAIKNTGKDLLLSLLGGTAHKKIPKGQANTPIDVDAIDKSTKVLGLIFVTMKKAREFELTQKEIEKEFANTRADDEDRRTEELVKALTLKRKPKKKAKKPAKEIKAPEKVPSKGVPKISAEKVITGAALVGTAALVGKEALAENVSKYESKSAGGYNAYNKGTVGNKMIGSDKPIDFSKMTITEYLRRGALKSGDPDRIFAAGRYQIIPDTMKDLVKTMKIDPNVTYLDPVTQDALFANGLVGTRRKKVDSYVKGKSDDKNGAILELAQEFASIGVPSDTEIKDKSGHVIKVVKKGDSYYSGVGGNKAHNSPEEVGAALDADRMKNLQMQSNKVSPVPTSTPSTGTQIDQSSKENKDMKAAAAVKQAINVNNVNSSQTQSTTTLVSPDTQYDDRNAHQLKK